MGWILLIGLIVLVVTCAVGMGLDWTDFLSRVENCVTATILLTFPLSEQTKGGS